MWASWMPFTSKSFWAHWLISNQLCWSYWRYGILTRVMKIGDHIKAVLFILPLTERLTEPLFPDFKKSRILDTVLHYFHRSWIWLFSLEALPNKPWIKPHQKPLLRATEHWPTLVQTDAGKRIIGINLIKPCIVWSIMFCKEHRGLVCTWVSAEWASGCCTHGVFDQST